jgi:hypothetical protein
MAWWKLKRVEGISTIAERIRRAGRMRRAHKLATRRSEARRLRCPLPRTIDDQELVPGENGLGDHGAEAARSQEPGKSSYDMNEKDDEIAHLLIVTNPGIA